MHPYKHCGLRCRLLIRTFLAATGFEPSPLPSGFTLSPLSPTCKHYPPLFSTFFGRSFGTIFWGIAKPSQGKKDVLERELNESYLRHERSQHVTGRQATGDLAQWHHTVFKI